MTDDEILQTFVVENDLEHWPAEIFRNTFSFCAYRLRFRFKELIIAIFDYFSLARQS